ncbi:hypothetical protein N234_31645 [Ralstonia pickettii DTP0602]|nr:hypothetical protein N234_31645 [Ralstonia pickettii DTP0602]
MLLSKTVTVAATAEPVTVAEVKTSARLDSDITELDSQIETLISGTRVKAEQETSRAYVSQTWRLEYTDWPRECLPLSPVTSLVSVEYFDGTEWQEAAGCALEARLNDRSMLAIPPDLLSALGSRDGARVRVEVQAGYAAAPKHVKAWITVQAVCMLQATDAPEYLDGLLDAERDWQ